jgi:hypothetical protein
VHLRLIQPIEPSEGDPFEPAELAATARPAEAREPWELQPCSALSLLVYKAEQLGLPLAVAVSLVCELRLVLADVGAKHAQALDYAARDATVRVPLSEADAAYLRLLTRGESRRLAAPREHIIVDLPSRLTSRLLDAGGPQALIDVNLLEWARGWERAAVLQGRTMCEWAALTALRAREG